MLVEHSENVDDGWREESSVVQRAGTRVALDSEILNLALDVQLHETNKRDGQGGMTRPNYVIIVLGLDLLELPHLAYVLQFTLCALERCKIG